MTSNGTVEHCNLVDFGPLAECYDFWYMTHEGMAHDLSQKLDALHFFHHIEKGRRLLHIEKGKRLLDVGCGTGHWSRFFATLGFTVTGIDNCPEMIEVAERRRFGTLQFQIGEGYALPFQEHTFDVVTAITVLEFLGAPAIALKEMVRCLKPRGRLFVGTLNRSAPLNQQRLAERREPYISGHLYTPTEFHDLLRPFGRVQMVSTNTDAALMNQFAQPIRARHGEAHLEGSLLFAEVRQ